MKNCKLGSAQRGVYHEEIVFKTFSKRNQNVLHHNNSIDKRTIVMNFLILTLIREFSNVGGLVIPWDHHIRSKTFLCLESTWKKLRKIYITNFSLSIWAFYTPDKNDIIKSQNRYNTSSVTSCCLKVWTK